jgi:flavin-dependent dehydrogenase
MVTGEAAGSTYSFSGEGIGKAFETGILAAEAVLEGRAAPARRSRRCASATKAGCASSSRASSSTPAPTSSTAFRCLPTS